VHYSLVSLQVLYMTVLLLKSCLWSRNQEKNLREGALTLEVYLFYSQRYLQCFHAVTRMVL